MLALITFIVGSVLLLVALLVLLRRAFGTSMLWGILGLLFAVPLYIYALLRWEDVPIRKPVYISLVGLLAMLVGVSGGALTHLTFIPENEVVTKLEDTIAPPKETPLPNEEAANAVQLPNEENYDPVLTGGELEQVDIEEMTPPPSVVKSKEVADIYESIPVAQVDRAIGKKVKLVLADGEQVVGTLTHHKDGAVIVDSTVAGGEIGYTYTIADIKDLSVLGLEPIEEEPSAENSVQTIKDAVSEVQEKVESTSTASGLEDVQTLRDKVVSEPNIKLDEAEKVEGAQ